jgi:hypothetical protein
VREERVAVLWRIQIDAMNGVVLHRENLVRSETLGGRVTGMVLPFTATDAAAETPIGGGEVVLDQAGSVQSVVTDDDGRYSASGFAAAVVALSAKL